MTQIIEAEKVKLYDLEKKFQLTLSEDERFFEEWKDNLPEISDERKTAIR